MLAAPILNVGTARLIPGGVTRKRDKSLRTRTAVYDHPPISDFSRLPSPTVAEVTEPFLLRARYILKDDQGRRQLTALGQERVQKLSH